MTRLGHRLVVFHLVCVTLFPLLRWFGIGIVESVVTAVASAVVILAFLRRDGGVVNILGDQ